MVRPRGTGALIFCVLLGLLTLAAFPLPLQGAEELRFFRIGTAATTGTYFQIGGVIASAISKPPGARDCDHGGSCGVSGLIAVAQATQGSIENVLAIGAGQLESAFVQSDVAHWAYSGEAPPLPPRCRNQDTAPPNSGAALLKSRGAIPGLRAIAALYSEDVHLVVRDQSPIHTLNDLKGKRVALGEPGSGTIIDARLVLEAAELSECDIQPSYLRLSQAVEELEREEIDAFFIVAGPPVPAVADVAAMLPVRLVPIDGAARERLTQRLPRFVASSIAGGTYAGINDEIETVGLTAQWIVADTVAEDLVYAITKALWQETTRRQLEVSHPAGKRIRLSSALNGVTLPLHPGAARFYHEAGMEVPAR